MLYFDHNATAPLSPAARIAWLEAQERYPANPSSLHRPGQRAEVALESARDSVASILGASPSSLVWTSGATESAAAVFAHLAGVSRPGSEAWISALEHPCVQEAARRFFGERLRILPAATHGTLDLAALRELLQHPPAGLPAAVALMAANNETGVLQPWQEARELCAAVGVPLVCDATQWLGRLPAKGLGVCDYVLGSGHKFGAPVGMGFLKTPAGGGFHPLVVGGPQEEGRRAGTQNVAGAVAFAAALAEAEGMHGQISGRLGWRRSFEERLVLELPGASVLGAETERLWNTVAFLPPPLADCRQRWVVRLDAGGVAASSGSACASGKEKPSHVLAAMGVAAADSDRVLRLSSGWGTTESDWERAGAVIRGIYQRFGAPNAPKRA